MTFLNPAILFTLVAAAIPLLIHFLHRTKFRNIPFSTLVFLKELQQQKIRRIKFKQVLLLILRTLIIILLVLAFARPSLRGSLSGQLAANARSSAVIVVDNSSSMTCRQGKEANFHLAKGKAQQIAAEMQPGDAVYLVSATDTNRTTHYPGYPDFTALQQDIDAIKTDYRLTNLSAALDKAQQLLRSSAAINREIFVLSDFQRTAFSGDSVKKGDPDIRVVGLPMHSEPVHNLAVTGLKIVTTIFEKDKPFELEAIITNTGNEAFGNKLAQLFVNNEKLAQTMVDLEPGSSIPVNFKFILNHTGFLAGYVLLEDDDMETDNRRFFSLYVPQQVKIGMLAGAGYDADIIQLALNPGSDRETRPAVDKITATQLSAANTAQYDVLALVNVAEIPAEAADYMVEYVRNGGGLVIILGENTNIQAFNRILPLLGLPEIQGVMGSLQDERAIISLSSDDLTHPIFLGMFESENARFDKPRFRFAMHIQNRAGCDQIIRYSSGDAFLLEKKFENGTILLMTSGMNPELTDLSQRTIFAPLMTRMFSYAATWKYARQQNYAINQALSEKLAANIVQNDLEMQRPDEIIERIEPVIRPTGAWLEYTATDIPGIYTLLANNQPIMQWAVNSDPLESDLTPVAETFLKDRYTLRMAARDADIHKLILENRYGVELWKYFALAALVLLIVEMILYRAGDESLTEKIK
ncbi:MAG TPA: BatA domain-containing protein [bacterium]|nr:BatA domain-containing protein [bacterium]HPN42929.1 BatA domain-containing protein [bacterium]